MGKNGLPESWEWKTLESISKIILGQSPPSSTYNENGEGLPFYQGKTEFGEIYPTPRKWCDAPKKIAEEGDVLISVRAPVGPTNICPETSCIGRGLAAIRPNNGISTKFILYLLRRFEADLAGKGTGTTFQAITGNQLKSFNVPVPSQPEQERIVTKLEETFTQLEAGVAELQNAKAQLKRYRAAVLKSAVEGELTREWRESHQGEIETAETLLARILSARREKWETEGGKGKYKEPIAPNTDDLPELPDGWVWINTDILLIQSLKNGHSTKTSDIGFPVLRLTALKNGLIDLNERKFGAWSKENAEPFIVEQGDFFVSRGNGSLKLVGRGGLVENKPDPVAFPDTLIRVRVNSGYCNIRYLRLVWDSHIVRSQIEISARTTAGIYKINQQDIQSFTFPLPPLPEQQRIVEMVERRLSVADEIEKELDGALVRAERLRGSVLKSAFEGRLA